MPLFQNGIDQVLPMIKQFEEIIDQTTSELTCNAEEKKEICLELADHLYSAYEFHMANGANKDEAIKQVVQDFGQTEEVVQQFQQVVNPLYGWMKKIAWVAFFAYSCAVLWKVIVGRLIIRIVEYVRADGSYYMQYVYSDAVNWTSKQFFDFTMWQSNVNFMPFEMIKFYATNNVNLDITIHNLFGNIILLLPLGLLLPFLFYKCKNLLSVTTIAFCTSLTIECIQFGLQIGMADIDDILLNTFGAMIGYMIAIGIFEVLSWRLRSKSFSHLE